MADKMHVFGIGAGACEEGEFGAKPVNLGRVEFFATKPSSELTTAVDAEMVVTVIWRVLRAFEDLGATPEAVIAGLQARLDAKK